MDQCKNPFHIDGCPGAAGGEHELRVSEQIWCQHCDQAAVFAVRFPYGVVALCARHGLELAQDATAYAIGALQYRPNDDSIWCRLRGTNVAVSECVASCPAPEQRAVCAFEFDPTVTPQMARYQAEGR